MSFQYIWVENGVWKQISVQHCLFLTLQTLCCAMLRGYRGSVWGKRLCSGMSPPSSESSGNYPTRHSAWSPLASLSVVPIYYMEAWDWRHHRAQRPSKNVKIEPRCSERGRERAVRCWLRARFFQYRDGVLDALTQQTGFTGIVTLLDFSCHTITKK